MSHTVAALIHSRLDYCNSVLVSVPCSTDTPLQKAAASFVHVTTLVRHWYSCTGCQYAIVSSSNFPGASSKCGDRALYAWNSHPAQVTVNYWQLSDFSTPSKNHVFSHVLLFYLTCDFFTVFCWLLYYEACPTSCKPGT